jgi:hypothetical protein
LKSKHKIIGILGGKGRVNFFSDPIGFSGERTHNPASPFVAGLFIFAGNFLGPIENY